MSRQTWWAIQNTFDGSIICVRARRFDAISGFLLTADHGDWKRWYRQGLRAVRVSVEPLEKDARS